MTTDTFEAFEYLTRVFEEREIQPQLDELGAAGWELITAKWEEYPFGGRTHNQARCILKRRVVRKKDIFADDLEDEDNGDEFASTLKALRSS
jgi:hypothetical protein